ncbi:Cell division protein FtsQ [hydrothermal vent metagenome]|uniref:Cell division protein FtsQ n=1 Tax=hydrothermal vent metagenome TaxID=652676 RepID=A0A3B0SF14_9ZZZZ
MQQITRPRTDPAPSRWSYRVQRLMLTPGFRMMLRAGLPFFLSLGLGLTYMSDAARQEKFMLALSDIRNQIESRPEFRVDLLTVEGADPTVEAEIREVLPVAFPVSSFDLDLDALRQVIAGLPAVADVTLRVRKGGILVAKLRQRTPVALWQSREGLSIIDIEGARISPIATRMERAGLPIVAGEGADKAIAEAMDILAAATPLEPRLRGLVRMGERRWDLVLDRGQRILLPEENPVQALERVIVLSQVQDMLARDLVVVDMRLAARPTLRMNKYAVEEWWRVKNNQ